MARNWAILSANGSVAQPQPLRLYTQDDTGTFQSAWQSAEVGAHLAVAWGDYDGDGDLDFGTGLEGTDRIYRNEAGSFVVAWTAPTTSRTVDVHWDDVDGDGDVDLLASGTGGVKIYRNTSGGFVTGDLVAGSFLGATEVVDMDNDGDRDLVTTSLDSVFVYLNNRGIYSLLWTGPVDEPYDIACADYDGDGDQDVAVGVWKGFRIYRQNGGTFVRAVSSETDLQPPTTNTAWAIAWIDSDSDGDPDLFTAQVDETGTPQRPAPAQLYKNTGGTFSIGWTSSETIFPTTVSVADFDHDGKPDLAIGSTPTATNPAHTNLYRNLGGAFALEWTSTDGENANDLAWTPL